MTARPLALCALALLLAACDSGDPAGSDPLADAKADPGVWTWVDVEGSQCRDGSPTGFGIRIQEGARDLAIYLEGGGACFDGLTCALNDPNFTEEDFLSGAARFGEEGIFSTRDDRPNLDNPVGDWNFVYVPYCTGDVHGGTAPGATVPGVSGAQQFVGHRNIERMLDLVAPNLEAPGRVLLTGTSAGGFGALVNFAEVADRFPSASHTLLDDSGPIFYDDAVFSPAIGAQFESLFGLSGALPADAAPLFEADGLEGVYAYYADRYPAATFGITSYLEDSTIRFFFEGGQPDGEITRDEYASGLRDLRDRLPERWGTYYALGDDHTFLVVQPLYFGGVAAGAPPLNEWLGGLIGGTVVDVDPEVVVRPLAAR